MKKSYQRQESEPIEIPTSTRKNSLEKSIQEKGTPRQRRHTIGGAQPPDFGSETSSPSTLFVGGINTRKKSLADYFKERYQTISNNHYDTEITDSPTDKEEPSHQPVTLFYETAKPYRYTQHDANAKLQEATQSRIDYLETEIRTLENNLSILRRLSGKPEYNSLDIQKFETQLKDFLENLVAEIRHKLEETPPLREQKDKSKSNELMLEKLKYCKSRLNELRSKASFQLRTNTTRDSTPPTKQYEDDNEYGLII